MQSRRSAPVERDDAVYMTHTNGCRTQANGGTQSTIKQRSRPAAPKPRDRPLNLFDLLFTLNRNPLEAWTRELYEQPIVTGESLIGRFAVISDPSAIRAVLVESSEQFPKDDLQKRLLRPALGDGLLTSEGE